MASKKKKKKKKTKTKKTRAKAKPKKAKKAAKKPAPSNKPNWMKLLVKPPATVLVANAPAGYDALLAAPAGVTVTTTAQGEVDVVHLFALGEDELRAHLPTASPHVGASTLFWVSYQKGDASFHRDTLWALMEPHGFEGVALISLDDTW